MKKYWYCVVYHTASFNSEAVEMHIYNTKAEAMKKGKELEQQYKYDNHYLVCYDWQWSIDPIEYIRKDTSIMTDHRIATVTR